jgi:hypothetical protein
MATVYFGANYLPDGYSLNGNWNDVNQWFSDRGDAGEDYFYPATPLGRSPNPATDTVEIMQNVTSGSGTYSGPVIGSYYYAFDAANLTWSGAILSDNATFSRGTFSGNLTAVRYFYIGGGTFTNLSSFSSTQTSYWRLYETDSTGGTTPNTLTFPAGFSINASNFSIDRSMTISFPITFGSAWGGSISVGPGYLTKQYPVFTRDMSTAVTSCTYYTVQGWTSAAPTVPITLSTVFTNTATFTIGTPTKPGYITCYDVQITRPTILYTAKVGDYDQSVFSYWYKPSGTINTPIVLASLTILTVQGLAPGNIDVSGPYTYIVTATVAVLPNQQIDPNSLPASYQFGRKGSTFKPTINLTLTQNLQATSE